MFSFLFRNALLAYRHLGTFHPDTSRLVNFVNSLYDSNAKLFRNTAGSTPDFKATARALQIFQQLELTDKDVATKKAEISEKLSAAIKEDDNGRAYFSTIVSFLSIAFSDPSRPLITTLVFSLPI